MESTRHLNLIRQFLSCSIRKDEAGLKQCVDQEVLIRAFSRGKLDAVHRGIRDFSSWCLRRQPYFKCRQSIITHLNQYQDGAVVDVDFASSVSATVKYWN